MIKLSPVKNINPILNSKKQQKKHNTSYISITKLSNQTKYLIKNNTNKISFIDTQNDKENTNELNFNHKQSTTQVHLKESKNNFKKINENKNFLELIKNAEKHHPSHQHVYSKEIEYQNFSIFNKNELQFPKKILYEQIKNNIPQILLETKPKKNLINSSDKLLKVNEQVSNTAQKIKIIENNNYNVGKNTSKKIIDNSKIFLYC